MRAAGARNTATWPRAASGSKSAIKSTAGQPIGLVGLSGDTEFFHLHFTVRRHGKIVDPFAFGTQENSCGGGRRESLWAASLGEQMQYRPGEIIDYGFAGIAPTMELIKSGEIGKHPVTPGSDALVAYVRTIGLQAGDQQFLAVQGPGGVAVSAANLPALDRDEAQFLVIAGKKRTETALWPRRPLQREVPRDQRRRGGIAKDVRGGSGPAMNRHVGARPRIFAAASRATRQNRLTVGLTWRCLSRTSPTGRRVVCIRTRSGTSEGCGAG